ncbi:MAG: hypothetical protein EA397_11770 [Deltaproteobacteria bacterium]|nr:MAG: hypothetical protein EA397_11770 [Deltaproteobacteria bacterium]
MSARPWISLAVLFSGCGFFQSDTFYCAGTVDGLTSGCLEFSDFDRSIGGQQMRASFAIYCSAASFAKAVPGECPLEGRIGGCRGHHEMYTLDTYSYEGEVESLEDIYCSSNDTKIGPDGLPWDPHGTDSDEDPICSDPSDGERTSIDLHNQTSTDATVYWGDFDCNEQRIMSLSAGVLRPLNTTVGHVFRVRAGSDVPNGRILAELTAEPDGLYEITQD